MSISYRIGVFELLKAETLDLWSEAIVKVFDAVVSIKDLLENYSEEMLFLILTTFLISLLCILWFVWMHARLYSDLECLFDRRIRFFREYGAFPCNILILNVMHIVWIMDCVIMYNPNTYDIFWLLFWLAVWGLVCLCTILIKKQKNKKELFFPLIFYVALFADLSVLTACYILFLQSEHRWTIIGMVSFTISVLISTWVLSKDGFGIQRSNIFLRIGNEKRFLFMYVGDSIICGDEQDRMACKCYNLVPMEEFRNREIYVQNNHENQDEEKLTKGAELQEKISADSEKTVCPKCRTQVLKNRNAYVIETIGIFVVSIVACIILGLIPTTVHVAILFAVVNTVITLFQLLIGPFDDSCWIRLLKSRLGSFGVLCFSIFGGGYVYEAVSVLNNSVYEYIAFLLILPALWLCHGMLSDHSGGV